MDMQLYFFSTLLSFGYYFLKNELKQNVKKNLYDRYMKKKLQTFTNPKCL